MVFPRFVAEQEDPELIAERELEAMDGNNSSVPAAVLRAKDASRAKEAAAVTAASGKTTGRDSTDGDEQRPIDRSSLSSISNSSASIDTVASSTNGPTAAGKPKEAKAERKKRSRGVSGCSIKKDGGRFDMGFEDLEDLDIEDYDDEEDDHFYRRGAPLPMAMTENTNEQGKNEHQVVYDARSELWVNAIQTAIVEQPTYVAGLFKPLFADEKCESAIIRRLAKEIQVLYDTRLASLFVGDVFAEYKIMELIRKLLEEDLLHRWGISGYLDSAVMRPHVGVDHVNELFVWTMMQLDKFEHFGKVEIITEIPEEPRKLARELATENCVGEIAHLIQEILPCFQASFVFEALIESIQTMSLNKVYYAVQSISELYEYSILSKESILIGLHRLVREVPELEKDLPCAISMVHLVFSYATNMLPVSDMDKEDLAPPKHMLYGTLGQGEGHLEVRDPPQEMGPLTAQNFMILDGEWPERVAIDDQSSGPDSSDSDN